MCLIIGLFFLEKKQKMKLAAVSQTEGKKSGMQHNFRKYSIVVRVRF